MSRQTQHNLRTIVHVELDAFFASVEEALHPKFRGRPLVVGGARLGPDVVTSSNYAARSFGIRPTTPIAVARELAPHATILRGDPRTYERFSQELFEILNRFTTVIEPVNLDEAYLDLTELPVEFLDAESAIRETIERELTLTVSIGVGSNKVSAKVAGELAKPGGTVTILRGEEREFLASLPVGLLPGVGQRTETFLKAFGIRTIGQLARVPQTLLYEHFGPGGIALWQFANGFDRRPVEAATVGRTISCRRALRQGAGDPRHVRLTVEALLGDVCRKARQDGVRGRIVAIRFRAPGGREERRQRTLAEPSDDPSVIRPETDELLTALLRRLPGVRSVNITLAGLTPNTQLSIFPRAFPQFKRIHEALARLRANFGFNTDATPQPATVAGT